MPCVREAGIRESVPTPVRKRRSTRSGRLRFMWTERAVYEMCIRDRPKIVGDSMGLPPLLTLFLLYLGFKVKGIAGMILAVPIGLIFINFYKYGAFDSMIENARLLVREINEFRKK